MIDLIGFTMILPLFPSILENYKKSDESGLYEAAANATTQLGKILGNPKAQSETVLIGGLLGSMFSFLQFLFAPMIGAYSDMRGRRQALLICLAGIATSHLLWHQASTFAIFIVSRIIGGIFRANVSLSYAIVADACDTNQRPKGMAMIGVAFSVGFVVGPSIGAIFTRTGEYGTAALICFGLSLLSFMLVLFRLPETLPMEKRRKMQDLQPVLTYISPVSLFSFKAVSTGKSLRGIGFAYFLYTFFYSGLEFTLTYLTHYKFQFTPVEQGKMFAYMGLGMALLQGTLARRLTASLEEPAVKIGMIIMIPAFFILGFCQDVTQLALGLFCYCIGSAIVTPSMTSMIAARVPCPNEKGVALGIYRSLGALARSVGPLAASTLFWRVGPSQAYFAGAVAFVVPLYVLQVATTFRPKKD